MGEVSTPAAPSAMSRPLEERNEDDSPVIISSSGNATFAYTDTSTATTRTGIPPTNSGSQNGPSASSTQVIQQSAQHESPPQPFLPPPLPHTHEWPPPGPYHANDMHTFGTTPWSYSTPSFETGPYHVDFESRSLYSEHRSTDCGCTTSGLTAFNAQTTPACRDPSVP